VNFTYLRRIKFYETDAMGIVHHANYLHFFEDARIELLRAHGFLKQKSLDQINYPLLESQVSYKKPLYFDDEIEVLVVLTSDLLRLSFRYEITTKRYPVPAAFGNTIHIAMDMETRKPIRLPDVLKNLT
jgi:acyl-CoA thioester hydrolase